MTAARAGSADVVNALIDRGANVNAAETWQGQTALMWAAAENHGDAIKALVAHGADLNARSKELSFPEYRYETNGMAVFQLPKGGWTALMYAARQNAMEAVSALADVARRSQRDDEAGRHDGAADRRSSTSTTTWRTCCSSAAPTPTSWTPAA